MGFSGRTERELLQKFDTYYHLYSVGLIGRKRLFAIKVFCTIEQKVKTRVREPVTRPLKLDRGNETSYIFHN